MSILGREYGTCKVWMCSSLLCSGESEEFKTGAQKVGKGKEEVGVKSGKVNVTQV